MQPGESADGIELADVAALLVCHVQGDEQACRDLLAAVPDGVRLASYGTTAIVDLACRLLPGGRDKLLAMLRGWQEQRKRSL